jgi:hypothetical protein
MSTERSVQKVFPPLDVDAAYYNDWAFRCKALLRRKNCLDVISVTRPTEAPEEGGDLLTLQETYDEKNNRALGYITDNLSAYALSKVKAHEESAKDTWAALREAYENKSMSNHLNILTRLIHFRMQEGTSLDLHYAALDSIVTELRLTDTKTAENEPLLTAILLASMPESFSTAVTAISMSTREMPSLEDVKKRLRDHSMSLSFKRGDAQSSTSSTPTVMTATSKETAKKKKKKKKGNSTKTPNPNITTENINTNQGFSCRGKIGVRGGRGLGRGARYYGRPEPYPRHSNVSNFWVANNQCSFCKRYGHQHTECRQLASTKSTNRSQAQTNLLSDQQQPPPPVYDNFGYIGMLTYNAYISISKNKTNNTTTTTTTTMVQNFYIDSGSNRYIVIDLNLLTNPQKLSCPSEIHLFKKQVVIQATHVGDVQLRTNLGQLILLKDVFYTPDGRCNILSIPLLQFSHIQFKIEYFVAYLYVIENGVERTLATGTSANNILYTFEFQVLTNNPSSVLATISDTETAKAELLHQKFCHLSYKNLKILYPTLKIPQNKICEVCLKAKQTRKKLNKTKERARSTDLLANVHTDVDELPIRSIENEKYFVTFIEESTHFTTVFNLKFKHEVLKYYKYYETRMLATYNRTAILNLYCDNGGEYVSREYEDYTQSRGTDLHKTIRNTSALNGVAERMNRLIMDRARACLIQSGLPPVFWSFAVVYSVYVINRSPTKALPDGKTPYEMLTGFAFDCSELQVFGCVAHSRPLLESKLHERSEKCIFLGFATNGCKVLNLRTRKIQIVRDVVFDSNTLYRDLPASEKLGTVPVTEEIELKSYQTLQRINTTTTTTTNKSPNMHEQSTDSTQSSTTSRAVIDSSTNNTHSNTTTTTADAINKNHKENTTTNNDITTNENMYEFANSVPVPPIERAPQILGNAVSGTSSSSHKVQVPKRKLPFVEHLYARQQAEKKQKLNINNNTTTNDSPLSQKKISSFDTSVVEEFVVDDNVIMFIHEDDNVPETYQEIFKSPNSKEWFEAVEYELNALKRNQTWTLVDRPANKNIISCRYIFRIKRDQYGKIDRYRARLVARGFSQRQGQDFSETFAPVAKMPSFRLLLTLAVQFDLLIEQIDVTSAFLHGELEDEIYMEVPEGIVYSGDKVCKLQRALYGLKQSPRVWHLKLHNYLMQIGFKQSKSDYCVYYHNTYRPEDNLFLLVYVDDLIICTKTQARLDHLKQKLRTQFDMKDSEPLNHFLGIQIERDAGSISISQTKYLQQILIKSRMENCAQISTPLELKINTEELARAKTTSPESKQYPCRNAIGSLMYAMLCTRPELSYAVGLLSTYQATPSKALWKLIKRVMRYIKGTLDLKLKFIKNNPYLLPVTIFVKQSTFGRRWLKRQLVISNQQPLICYVDASFNTNDHKARSTSGVILKVFGNSIIWWSRRQPVVALSTLMSEFLALCEGVREVLWLKGHLNYVGIRIYSPVTIFEDNLGCIAIAKDPTNHKATRHMNPKLFFVRDEIRNGSVKLEHISTIENIADIFTKSLARPRFEKLRRQLGLLNDTDDTT